MRRQNVLKLFLNDQVTKVNQSLYLWRGIYYEIRTLNEIKKDKTTKIDHFVKVQEFGHWYGIRECSKAVLKKHYNLTF